ncbi:MAG: hypothetical protein ABI601_04430 [bacterium]
MRRPRIPSFLLATGLLVGGAAALALLVGFDPSRLPATLVKIALFKLMFIAAAGLLVAGAYLGRRARMRRDLTHR